MVGARVSSFIATLKQMPAQAMAAIEAHRPGGLEPAHARDEIGFGSLDQQVVVIAHEHIRMDAPAGAPADLAEGPQETLAVGIVAKDVFPPVAPIQDVVKRAAKFEARFPGHVRRLATARVTADYIIHALTRALTRALTHALTRRSDPLCPPAARRAFHQAGSGRRSNHGKRRVIIVRKCGFNTAAAELAGDLFLNKVNERNQK